MPQTSRVIPRPSPTPHTQPHFWGVEGGLKGGRGASSPSLVNAGRRPMKR